METVTETKIEYDLKEIANEDLHQSFKIYANKVSLVKNELQKVMKGQDDLLVSVLRGFICNGNILLEGMPGVGKTVLCKCLAEACQLDFKRVQFTTDLLPSDIVGLVTFDKERGFEIVKGPVFCNLMLADEINRAPPKVQSALLEAMGEHQVTLGKETKRLQEPFIVIGTQNPIEQSGTFPLPEAQIDRFMFKINVGYPDLEAEFIIMDNNLTQKKMEHFGLKPIMSQEDILIMQALKNYVHVEAKLKHYILNIVNATRKPKEFNLKYAHLIGNGASPRASISLLLASKAQALLNGRHYVIPQDIKDVVHEVLRHRIYINFKAKMENVTSDDIIDEIVNIIKIY